MNRKLVIATLGCVIALAAATAASAAPKPDHSLEIVEPEVVCDAPNHVTVTASVSTTADLENFFVGVQRWEDLNPRMEGWAPRFDMVEGWSASFERKRTEVPVSHVLATRDPDTWTDHTYVADGHYEDVSDIFVITADAWAKAGKRDLRSWAAYAVDCAQSPHEVVPFTWPYEVPRYCETPPQAPRLCE